MQERSDCDSMESTIPQTTLWNLPKDAFFNNKDASTKTVETDEESDVSSIDESSKVGSEEEEENSVSSSTTTMRQDRSKVEEKYEENKGTADKQMRKITDQIEKLRMQLCKIPHEDGSELSREEKLKSENSFLIQVNEILHNRLYKAVSMLEVEEDYSLELEAKIEKLEAKVKERDGVINQMSVKAAAVAKSRSNKQREAAKCSPTKETNMNMKRENDEPSSSPSSMKGRKETTEVTSRPGMSGRRALFQRSESLGDLGDVEDLGFHGAMACVLSGDGLDESERHHGNAPAKNGRGQSNVKEETTKGSRRTLAFKRSSSLWDLSSDTDDDDKLKTDTAVPNNRSTKKSAYKKPPLAPSMKRNDSIGSTSSSSSMMGVLKSKSKRKEKNELDSASLHSTSSKSKGKKKAKDKRSGLLRCNSLSDLRADLDDSPSSVKKKKTTSKSMKRSNSAEDLGTKHCSKTRESSSSKKKEGSKSAGNTRSGLQRSNSHSNVFNSTTKGKAEDDALGSGSLHSSLSKSKKSQKGADKKIKFNGKKRSSSVGDMKHAAREATPTTPPIKEDEESSEALKYLLDDLWSKRKEDSSVNSAPLELKMGDSLNRLLKSNSMKSMPSNNNSLPVKSLSAKSLSAKPLPMLKLGKTSSNNNDTVAVEHPTKNAEWGRIAESQSSDVPFWPPRDLPLVRQLSKQKLVVPN